MEIVCRVCLQPEEACIGHPAIMKPFVKVDNNWYHWTCFMQFTCDIVEKRANWNGYFDPQHNPLSHLLNLPKVQEDKKD